MRYTRDIETELYNLLEKEGRSVSAHAVPATLGASLPHTHVVRTGGYEQDMVIEASYIDFDVYAKTGAEAMTAAAELCGWVRSLAGEYCYTSEVTTLPYNNPDPRHPDIARATFKVQMLTRIIERS